MRVTHIHPLVSNFTLNLVLKGNKLGLDVGNIGGKTADNKPAILEVEVIMGMILDTY